jgi:hypothetical protein
MLSHRKITAIAALLLFVTSYVVLPNVAVAQNAAAHSTLSIPVSGSFAPSTTSGSLSSLGSGTVTGVFTIQRFAVVNGTLSAIGNFVGTLTGSGGSTNLSISNIVVPLVGPPTGTCQILTLDIGAIHLDLLGLVIDLSPIHLSITAVSGPGNLLGNLLCAIANLLNNNGPLSGIANLLNQILAAL